METHLRATLRDVTDVTYCKGSHGLRPTCHPTPHGELAPP